MNSEFHIVETTKIYPCLNLLHGDRIIVSNDPDIMNVKFD